MKSLLKRFKQIEQENPYWSSFACFTKTIQEQKLTKRSMGRWFDRLVDRGDWAENNEKSIEREELINQLRGLIKIG